jgi:hypothetical protein
MSSNTDWGQGTITGAINGTVLQLGTEYETYPASANFTESVSPYLGIFVKYIMPAY